MKYYIALNWYCLDYEFLSLDNAKSWLKVLETNFPSSNFRGFSLNDNKFESWF